MQRVLCWKIALLIGFIFASSCSSNCPLFDSSRLIDTGLVTTEDVLHLFDKNDRCSWNIYVPDDGREYRFIGQITGRKCGKNRLTIEVNRDEICNSKGSRIMTSDCLVSPSITIDYKREKKDNEGFTLTYDIEPCYDIEATTKTLSTTTTQTEAPEATSVRTTIPTTHTPEVHVLNVATTTSIHSSQFVAEATSASAVTIGRPQMLIEVFVPIVALLSAALIGLVIYIKCRHKKNEVKNNTTTQMTTINPATGSSQTENTAEHGASAHHNEDFYASIYETANATYSSVQEPAPERSDRRYYEILDIPNGNLNKRVGIDAGPSSRRDDLTAAGSESTFVTNILYGSS